MSLLDGFAQQLDVDGHGVWSPDAPYGASDVGIVIGEVPAQPEQIVALTRYRAADDAELLGYDQPNVQVRVRGTEDERVSRERAQAIFDSYTGATSFALPDGTYVVLIVGLQGGPISMGRDDAGRCEHTVNFSIDYRNPTEHRQ